MKRCLSTILLFVFCFGYLQAQPASSHDRKLTGKEVLEVYGEISKRTVLAAKLPEMWITLKASAVNQQGIAAALSKELAAHRLMMTNDGDKFMIIMRENQTNMVTPHSAQIVTNHSSAFNGGSPQQIQSGTINLVSASVPNVIYIYAALVKARPPDRSDLDSVPSCEINLQTETNLSREEVIYALDTLFALNGIKVVKSDDDVLKVVPITHR